MNEYKIIKETTTQYVVCVRLKNDEHLLTPIARCDTEAVALTIKGMYEAEEKKDEDDERD